MAFRSVRALRPAMQYTPRRGILSMGLGIASFFSYNAIIVEPETQTKFNDELMMMVYPGLKKEYPHSLTRLWCPVSQPFALKYSYFKERYMSKPFVVGEYHSATANLYRIVMLTDYRGEQLWKRILPAMLEYSESKYNTEVSSTRTGSLFVASLSKLKMHKGDEIVFLCNQETNNFTIWVTTNNQQTAMHFTIESELLIDCINHTFGDDNSPVFNATYKA